MKLVLINTPHPKEYVLSKSTIKIGSASDADICLFVDKVAPYHAVIWQNRGKFAIGHWNNQGVVFVNGKQAIQGQPLWPRDKITLGEADLIFMKDDTNIDNLSRQTSPSSKSKEKEKTPSAKRQKTASELQKLAGLDSETLEKLRNQSPVLRPASGLTAFLQQGLARADNQREKGLFGLIFAVPAAALSIYQAMRNKISGTTSEEAFPEGTWQFYTQFGLREDPARHANETDGFQKTIPSSATELDQAAAWVFQCITTMFEYESLLENEWVERTLLRLVHEALANSVVEKVTLEKLGQTNINPNSAEFENAQQMIRENEVEHIEIETAEVKRNLGLSNLEWAWVTKRPYRKPSEHTHETYPQYRRKIFLEFLVEVSDRMPTQMGAIIWDRYHELSSTALPAYQSQMTILNTLRSERHQDEKDPIELWKAKLGFVMGGRYYLLNVAHHDERGRLLVFRPGKPDDRGEPLVLRRTETDKLVDQQGRQISVDRKGNVTISDKNGNSHIKVLRRTPASLIKAQIATILREAELLSPSTISTDKLLAIAPRDRYQTLVQYLPKATQVELEALNDVPIIINWDKQNQQDTLRQIRSEQRGTGNHALTIFRTENTFVFDQSHIFYDAIWGMVISQVITDGAVESYHIMANLPQNIAHASPPSPLRLQSNAAFQKAIKPYTAPFEVTAETETPDLKLINASRKKLATFNIQITVNDLLTFYRSIHDQQYSPGLDLQRALVTLRLDGNHQIADQIEAMWENRKSDPVSLLLPMDASFVDPKHRLFPATFRNFLPDFVDLYQTTLMLLDELTYSPSPSITKTFQEKRGLLMANLVIMTEYFQMLKRITRQGESISTAAIKYLAHLPPGMQGTLDSIPQHVGALNEILKGDEVFSNVGRVSPASSLIRFMSAKDDGNSKLMVWGIMCDRTGNLKIVLRDFRPHAAQLLKSGYETLATLIVKDYLEAYASGLNQFAEELGKIVMTEV